MSEWKLNDEQAQQIIDTPPTKVKETGALFDVTLPKKQRIENAKKIISERTATYVGQKGVSTVE